MSLDTPRISVDIDRAGSSEPYDPRSCSIPPQHLLRPAERPMCWGAGLMCCAGLPGPGVMPVFGQYNIPLTTRCLCTCRAPLVVYSIIYVIYGCLVLSQLKTYRIIMSFTLNAMKMNLYYLGDRADYSYNPTRRPSSLSGSPSQLFHLKDSYICVAQSFGFLSWQCSVTIYKAYQILL